MVMNMIRAIIFDVYGTLISTGNGSITATERILVLNNREDISPNIFYKRWKELHREHISELQSFVPERVIFERDLCKLYQEYGFSRNALDDVHIMLDTLGCRQAFPETRKVLEQLLSNYIVAVGSTTDMEPLVQDITRNALPEVKIFTSESIKMYKPQADFIFRF